MKVQWIDRTSEVLLRHQGRMPAVLQALGAEAVSLVVQQMQHGYGKPIRQTGALQRDVCWSDSPGGIQVGNSLPYAVYVHEGRAARGGGFTPGRPYLRDGLENGAASLEKAAADALRQGLK